MATRVFATRAKAGPRAADVLGNGGLIAQRNPSHEERREQLLLAELIEWAFDARGNVAGEAGTGVGKSFAYLVPAIQKIGESKRAGRPEKVCVAVPTIALQEQLVAKDLPFLQTVMPERFRFALLKGMRNYLCRYKFGQLEAEPSFADPADAACWPDVQTWARSTSSGDISELGEQLAGKGISLPMAVRGEITTGSDECLGESCPAFDACHVVEAKARAADADVIVTNYAILMLHLRLQGESGGMAGTLPDGIAYLVLDECHQLREAAAKAFSREVTYGRFDYAARRIERLAKIAEQAAVVAMAERRSAELAQMTDDERKAAEYAESEHAMRMHEPANGMPGPDANCFDCRPQPAVVEYWRAAVEPVAEELRAIFEHYLGRCTTANESAMRLGDELDVMYDAARLLDDLRVKVLSTPAFLADDDRKAWEKLPDQLAELTDDLIELMTGKSDRTHVRAVSVNGTPDKPRAVLSITPIDVAPILRRGLWNTTLYRPVAPNGDERDAVERVPLTCIAVSATIATEGSLTFFRRQVGMNRAREIIVGSPFDYERNALLYIPSDAGDFDATAARRGGELSLDYLNRLADRYEQLVLSSKGRAFCLFTSNKVMEYVYKRLSPRLRGFLVLKQGEYPQSELVRRFKADGNAILFGVKSFWEGVDVQGDALSLVIISGMPFTPPSDPLFSARCQMIDREYGPRASFQLLSIPEATIALKQAFGRGIRSKSDRAVIAILDGRLRVKRYGPGVIESLPPATLTGSLDAVRAFYGLDR